MGVITGAELNQAVGDLYGAQRACSVEMGLGGVETRPAVYSAPSYGFAPQP